MYELSPIVRLHSQRVGDDQTKQLYDALTLMRTLTPSLGPRAVVKTDWHRFLDYLSWLCDSKRGGQTVTSIAVEWSEGTAKFWIANNSTHIDRQITHLNSLLANLAALQSPSNDALEAATRDVFAKSITFSRSRVHNYTRKLRQYVVCVEVQIRSDGDQSLFDSIKEMLAIPCHQQRCSTAYGLRHHEYFRNLSKNAESDTPERVWYWIRHYIGRLGSWFVASRFLVAIARQYPQLFENFKVISVNRIGRNATRVVDKDMSLRQALLHTLPGYNSELVDLRVRTLQAAMSGDLAARFTENYTNPKFVPKVHAETLMMEHFYFNELHFFENDRYIGCRNFETRPCHGNVWVKWCLPFEVDEGDLSKQIHAAKMYKRILINIVRDLESRLLSGINEHEHACDSTTALSRLSILASR